MLRQFKELNGYKLGARDGEIGHAREFYFEDVNWTVRQPAEANAVKFDVALTVCAMRYIYDLPIGKVNPKHLDFAFDEESRKYDSNLRTCPETRRS